MLCPVLTLVVLRVVVGFEPNGYRRTVNSLGFEPEFPERFTLGFNFHMTSFTFTIHTPHGVR